MNIVILMFVEKMERAVTSLNTVIHFQICWESSLQDQAWPMNIVIQFKHDDVLNQVNDHLDRALGTIMPVSTLNSVH